MHLKLPAQERKIRKTVDATAPQAPTRAKALAGNTDWESTLTDYYCIVPNAKGTGLKTHWITVQNHSYTCYLLRC